jgi:O-antigen/teichoic acid export membrane protein
MSVIFLPLYVQHLGPEALGLIGFFTLLQTWFTLLDLGITPTLTREMARFTAGAHSAQSIASLLRSLETVAIWIALLITALMWLGAGPVVHSWLRVESLPVDEARQTLQVMGLVIALRFVEGIYRGALLGLQRHLFYNAVNAAMATIRFGGALAVVALVTPSVRAFYLWQAAASLASLATFATAVHRSMPPAGSRAAASPEAVTSVGRFAGGMFVITGLSLLASQLDKVLLSRLLSLEEFGYYTLAAATAGALTLVVAPIVQSVYPRLVELATAADDRGLAGTYHQWSQMVLVATVPLMVVLTVFPAGVMYVWSEDMALAVHIAPLLMPLALGTFFNALMWMPHQSQLACGWTGLAIRINIIAVACIVPALLLLVPRYGAAAAPWVWVALNAAYLFADVHVMHRRILREEKGRWYLHDVAAPLSAAVLAGLLLWLAAPAPTAPRMVWAAFLAGVAAVTLISAVLSADCLRPQIAGLLSRSWWRSW